MKTKLYREKPLIVLVAVFLVLIFSIVFRPFIDTMDRVDESHFHYPTILQFAEQFPNFDFTDYNSATTPLYHVFIAVFALIVSPDILFLRLVSAVWGVLCVMLVYFIYRKNGKAVSAGLFTAVFMLSPYFIGPSVRLSTDNFALFFALLAFYYMENKPDPIWRLNLAVTGAVLSRQIYSWLIAVYPALIVLKGKRLRPKHLLPILIPVTGISIFILLWHGLNPPSFAYHGQGLNADIPVYVFSLYGFYGLFFLSWFWRTVFCDRKTVLAAGAAVVSSLGFLLLFPVSNIYSTARGGMLWRLAEKCPMAGPNSLVFIVLMPVGLFFLFVVFRYLYRHKEYLMICAFPLWLLANSVQHRCYQKYLGPFILFFWGYFLVRQKGQGTGRWVGPGLFLLFLAAIAVVRFYGTIDLF